MIAVDTNVLLRYLFHADDPAQGALAVSLVDGAARRGDEVFISPVVLCELVWTLKSAFGLHRSDLIGLLEALLAHSASVAEEEAGAPRIVFHDEGAVRSAVDDFARGKAEFSDYVIGRLAESAGASATYTFDRVAGAAATFKRLKPSAIE